MTYSSLHHSPGRTGTSGVSPSPRLTFLRRTARGRTSSATATTRASADSGSAPAPAGRTGRRSGSAIRAPTRAHSPAATPAHLPPSGAGIVSSRPSASTDALQRLAGGEVGDVGLDPVGQQRHHHLPGVGGVRRDDAVRRRPQRVAVGQRLRVGHVQAGAADRALLAGPSTRASVCTCAAPGHVDQPGPLVHGLELARRR